MNPVGVGAGGCQLINYTESFSKGDLTGVCVVMALEKPRGEVQTLNKWIQV